MGDAGGSGLGRHNAQQQRVVVLDSGGCTLKAGFSTTPDDARVLPNCMAKAKGERAPLIGGAVLRTPDLSSLTVRRPIDRGYLVNTDLQRDIWAHSLADSLHCGPSDTALLLTEPVFNLPSIQEATDQVVFEEMGFTQHFACPACMLSLLDHTAMAPHIPANAAHCGLVVDAGFSFTHALPLFEGQLLLDGVRRINLGGKALTNFFKELVSYRSVNMMDESFLVQMIKDAACFVSPDAGADLRAAHSRASPHRLEYVLPDGLHNTRGYVRDPANAAAGKGTATEQVLQLNNERFMVPEALFHPTDIGLNQAGLAETIVQSVEATHQDLHELLYSNIILTGGTAKCPGFKQRLLSDLRSLVPQEYDLQVHMPDDPAMAAFKGGARFAASPLYQHFAWTKLTYEEHGSARLHGHGDSPPVASD